ncbi:hypothetical protein MKK84_24270 [Methylobacterium sp. E-065]|uniref:hypothetical protein n=1 Tax=Methylobacterium sp. E-065 TaxID=2836583 RepID=UPI001FB9FACF|nr:hypothetical protein [Methylobacterium sp. E-065]MCJ2020507.1 hypothetical protein [Methylobacterium sp. E-065]
MTPTTITKPIARPRRKSVPTRQPELPVEDLRLHAVLNRVRSPALAAVIAGLAFPAVDSWQVAR